MIRIEFVEREEDGPAPAPGAPDAPPTADARALAAVEAALSDLLAAAIPDDPPRAGKPDPAPSGSDGKPRRRRTRRRLTAPRGVPLREALLRAFARIVSVARGTLRHVERDPESALHDFRKSIRRARALVSLLRPALGRTAARGLAGELRRAFQATGPLRDADILIATLRSVASDDPALPAIERRLEDEQSGDGSRAAEALADGGRILKPLPDVLRVTLPADFSMDDLARGLARSWRRARAALERAEATRADPDFHEWRKRAKETRYQIELLASSGSPALRRREKTFAALAEELGKITDLIVLQASLAERQKAGAIPEAPALAENIHAAIAAGAAERIEQGREIFAESPADFARQVLAERG